MIAELTPAHVNDLVPRMRDRDRYEILGGIRGDMGSWARGRFGPGVAFAVVESDGVMAIGGALDGPVPGTAALWVAFAYGWERFVKQVLRVYRVIVEHGGYRRIECKCYADNNTACRFAERTGFEYEGVLRGFTVRGEDVVQYGRIDHGGIWRRR